MVDYIFQENERHWRISRLRNKEAKEAKEAQRCGDYIGL
jgi:hypothetical protein